MSIIPRVTMFANRVSQLQIRQCLFQSHSVSKKINFKYLETIPQSQIIWRWNSTKNFEQKHEAKFEEVVGSLNKPKIVIIDVRNPDEVQSTGLIPSSINIPLDNLQKALTNMSEDEFKRQYHRSKPSHADQLIFYCKSGRRASKALDTALTLGYSQSKKYTGSWDEWSSKQK